MALVATAVSPSRLRGEERQGVRKRVGFVANMPEYDPEAPDRVASFRKQLEDLGWIEGTNIEIQHRWGNIEKASNQARELVAWKADVLVGSTLPVVRSLMRETRSIPIVFNFLSDPIAAGVVASLSRP